jgi:NADPH:quinone reductase-like Zn-dependent oxidoreductase
MKALVFYQHGGVEQLQYATVPEPVVGPGEALIEVKAALNHLDLWVRAGIPGLKLAMPHIGGSDSQAWSRPSAKKSTRHGSAAAWS